MMNMNSGYVGWSMSFNASLAYEQGEKPKSKWTKKAMIEEIKGFCDCEDRLFDDSIMKMKKDEVFSKFFMWTSWHHTSKFCNETDFYGLNEDEVKEVCREMTDEEIEERDRIKEEARKEREAAEAEARAWEEEQEEARRAWAEKEAAMDKAREDYFETHGFDSSTFAAFALTRPEKVSYRMSLKGNEVMTVEFAGEKREVLTRDAKKQELYGFDAVEL